MTETKTSEEIILDRQPSFKRYADGKMFKVTFMGHWSTIRASDGEEDSVKWYGDGYVSNKGHSYVKWNDKTDSRIPD